MRKSTAILIALLALLIGVCLGAIVQDKMGVKVIERRIIDVRVEFA